MSRGFNFDSSSLTLYRGSVILETKRKIAQKLFELTDLTVQQIAQIVEIDKEILEKQFAFSRRSCLDKRE